MSTDHTALIERHVGLLNGGDVPGYMELYALDCVFHGYPAQFTPDHVGIARFYTALTQGFPDAQVAPADLVVAGDRVVVRYVLTGTHTGEFLGAPATGTAVTVEGITILRFSDGQVAERWNRLDDVALLTQIGALPRTEQQPA